VYSNGPEGVIVLVGVGVSDGGRVDVTVEVFVGDGVNVAVDVTVTVGVSVYGLIKVPND
jgi:hypothetical protein